MVYPTRIKYTAAQKAEMWDRWQKGESLNSIARLFDRNHSSIQGMLAATGGIRPRERRRSQLRPKRRHVWRQAHPLEYLILVQGRCQSGAFQSGTRERQFPPV